MPRVTLFRIVSLDNYSDYNYDSYEIMSAGGEMVDVSNEELELLKRYCKKDRNRKFILAIESNDIIPKCIKEMIEAAKKDEIQRKEIEEREKEKNKIKKQKSLERKQKQLEKLKREIEGESIG